MNIKIFLVLLYQTPHFINPLKPYKMAKKAPWHSIKQNVYHNDTNCNTGNNIERENLRQGTGNKPLCKECAGL